MWSIFIRSGETKPRLMLQNPNYLRATRYYNNIFTQYNFSIRLVVTMWPFIILHSQIIKIIPKILIKGLKHPTIHFHSNIYPFIFMNTLLEQVQNQRKLKTILLICKTKQNSTLLHQNKVEMDCKSKLVQLSIQQMLRTLYRRPVEELDSTFSVREMKFYLANLFWIFAEV